MPERRRILGVPIPFTRQPRLIEQATHVPAHMQILQSAVQNQWGSQQTGWLESNDQFTVDFLHGNETSPGKLIEIRRTDDVIAPAASSRREMLCDFDYQFRPTKRFANDPIAVQLAAEISGLMHSMPDKALEVWVSETYDYWWSSGVCPYELEFDADKLYTYYIRPGLIKQFNPNPHGYSFHSMNTRGLSGKQVTIDATKLACFMREPFAGEFYGESGARCMVAPSEATLRLYSALYMALRFSTGFPYATNTSEGNKASAEDVESVQRMFNNMLKGTAYPIFVDQIEFKMLASTVPALQQFGPLAQHQDERKQAAARNALNNLGMRGVGSRSLGETVYQADMKALKAHLNTFMKVISGQTHANGSLLRVLTAILGYPEEYDRAVEIGIVWDEAADMTSGTHLEEIEDTKSIRELRDAA